MLQGITVHTSPLMTEGSSMRLCTYSCVGRGLASQWSVSISNDYLQLHPTSMKTGQQYFSSPTLESGGRPLTASSLRSCMTDSFQWLTFQMYVKQGDDWQLLVAVLLDPSHSIGSLSIQSTCLRMQKGEN